MNRGQFKDPVAQMCLAGAVVSSQFLTQEVSGHILVTDFGEFNGNT